MIPAGNIVENILKAMRRYEDEDMTTRVWRILNEQYFDICRRHSWKKLRRPPIALDFSAATSTGLWIPSNLFGINRVRDNTNDFEFLNRDRADAIEPDDDGYRFYTYPSS